MSNAATLPDLGAERGERLVAAGMLAIPTAGIVAALAMAACFGVSRVALALFAAFYIVTMAGVEIGLHRYFSHRSFKCSPAVRLALGIAGSMAGQGPVLFWAATHRRHHRYSDTEADPHAPLGHGFAAFRRAHLGWLFEPHRYEPGREAPDLVRDSATVTAQRHYLTWFGLGLAAPALLGLAATGTGYGALESLLWGGLVRVFAVHHATWSVNSLCHLVGAQPWRSRDGSRNIALLALPTLGGAWHNNHHAFPASATTSLAPRQIDPSWWLIRAAEAVGLVWDVRRPPPQSHLRSRAR
jgi:stearoyl-CoA desaturase (delta-9 desaturase)